MKKIVYNYEEDITYEKNVNKVRAVVINKLGRCLIVKYAGLYMLPGGKIDEGETDIDALKREIQEESGIEINIEDIEPYLELVTYDKNYYDRKEKRDINRMTNTKFYIIYTNEEINDNNKQLTESEKEQKQEIEFMNLPIIPYLVKTNKSDNKKRFNFDREILIALEEFKKVKENEIGNEER